MKTTTLYLALFALFTFSLNAQDNDLKEDYNKWSIDLGVGLSNASTPITNNYFTGDFEDLAYNLSARHMLNEKFGFKVGALYSKIEGDSESIPFSTNMLTFSGETVFNLGSILNFEEFTNRFNLLFHAGMQISSFDFQETQVSPVPETDHTYGFMAGITPQIKLSNRIALNLDLTVIGNLSHDLSLAGVATENPPFYTSAVTDNFDGMIVTATAGLSIYLGKQEKHADWVRNSSQSMIEKNNKNVIEDKIDSKLQDTDQDGVLDFLDREPNTTSGVAVNTKGESIDVNENGIPDELEQSFKETYVTKEYAKDTYYTAGLESVKPNANDDMINVYFKFDSAIPEYYSLDAISLIVKYMSANSDSKAVLTGYADEIGNTEYNTNLAEKRAKTVYDILIASGIDESRLSYQSGGVDSSVDKDSEAARQIVRRVSFKLE